MKWLTAILPYLAVGMGLLWIQRAWLALLGFHVAIILSLLIARSSIPVTSLFKSRNIRCVVLSVLLCGSSGVSLYFFWSFYGVGGDLPAHLESLGLTGEIWPPFVAYFALANPFIEEYFWRGYLGSPRKGLSISDFLYAGFHAFILWDQVAAGTMIYSLSVLVLAGWFWRQIARLDGALLAAVLGHMAADFTILMAVWRISG